MTTGVWHTRVGATVPLHVKRMQVHFNPDRTLGLQVKILNWRTGQWDDLSARTTEFTGGRVDEHLKDGDLFRYQVVNTSSTPLQVVEPQLLVEGEVINP